MKPRLLDLFCGAVDAQMMLCYNKVCQQSSVSIATEKLKPYDHLGKSFVPTVALSDTQSTYPTCVIAKSVVRNSLSIEAIKIGATALRRVARRLTKRILWHGTKHTLVSWLLITPDVLPNIQGHGERNNIMSALKSSAYWGVNV